MNSLPYALQHTILCFTNIAITVYTESSSEMVVFSEISRSDDDISMITHAIQSKYDTNMYFYMCSIYV